METTLTVKPRHLRVGDALASDPSIHVVAVYDDPEGTWVDFSDGDCGYLERSLTILRED